MFKLRSLYSFIAIVIFLILAIASDGFEEHFENCMEVNADKKHSIWVYVVDKDNKAIENSMISMRIYHEEFTEGEEHCTGTYTRTYDRTIEKFTDASGLASYTTRSFDYEWDVDKTTVEVKGYSIVNTANIMASEKKFNHYDQKNFTFHLKYIE